MLTFTLDEENRILHVRPGGALQKDDFAELKAAVDPFISEHGKLNGLLIETRKFPGWENFAAALEHFHFIDDHHTKIKKVALVTDSMLGNLAEKITGHFIAAEIKHFAAGDLIAARSWLSH